MKKHLLFAFLFMTAGFCHAQKQVGGDISLLPKYEANGAKYYDTNGKSITDMLTFLKNQGMNSMRVRLFVNPDNATKAEKGQGVCQDLNYVISLGKRIKEAGMSFVLDFHYSDTWADPAKQWTPKDWLSLSDAELYQKIYDYTKDCLTQCVQGGATPDYIQTGNEISYGMLYGKGIITKDVYTADQKTTEYKASDGSYKKVYAGNSANWERFVTLLKQAGKACREVCPQAKIILHTERVANVNYMKEYYSQMNTSAVDYDIIGLSYYPYYHGNLEKLDAALTTMENTFSNKEIMIVETGYYHHWQPNTVTFDYSSRYPISETGQKNFTISLITILNTNHPKVTGLYWWMMEANEHGLDWNTKRVTDDWYNAGLFDNETGKAQAALYEMKQFAGEGTGISSIAADSREHQSWYSVDGRRLSGQPTTKGLYIHQGKKVVIR